MILRLIFFFQLITFICPGQKAPWQPITISDGLSQGMIYDLLEDKEGFIWFATKDGLNRYDGYNFKVFTHDPYNDNSISGNTCTALLQDSKGKIWIGTEKDGLNLFNPENQRFYHAAISDKDQANAGNYGIIFIKEDADGTIWILSDKPGKIFKIRPPKSFPGQRDFTNLVETSTSATSGKDAVHFKYDHHPIGFTDSEKVYASDTRHPKAAGILYSTSVYKVLEDKKNRFWAIGQDSIVCWKNNLLKLIRFPKGGQSTANQFPDETIAICNQEYTWLFKPEELLRMDSLTIRNAYTPMPAGMNAVNHIFKDHSGNIWASTKGYGLLKFNPRVKQFQSYLPGKSPASLFQDFKGNVYVHGNYNPAYRFYKLNKFSNTIESLPAEIGKESYEHDAIYQDRQHQFWLIFHEHNVFGRILLKLSQDWKVIKKYPLPPIEDHHNFSSKLHEDDKGIIWLGLSNGGLFRFDPRTEQFKTFIYKSLLPKSGSIVENFCLYQDGKTMWIGTQKGLIRVENFQFCPSFSIYKNSKTDRQSLSNDFVSGAINDPLQPEKFLWVSTKGGGLERLDKQTGKFEHFTEARGLPNKVVYGVLVGDDNNLWMSTNRGLSMLNPNSLIFTNFNKSDGLQDDEFNTNSYFKAPNGELLFGGIQGMNIFRASALESNNKRPITKIVGLKINNKYIEPGDESNLMSRAMEYVTELSLSHDQNQITLEFVVMDFTNPVKNRFRYQLEGIDDDWVEAGTNRFANYAQLPDGKYKFKVMGSTNGEVWSQPTELRIRVNPPFYKTWWAYFIYLITIAYLWYRWNESQLKRVRLQEQILYKDKEAGRLAELDTLKTNFFANISHEFRTPLTLLVGPLSTFSKKYPSEEMIPMMQRNLLRLQALINQLLDLSKLEAGKMRPQIQNADISHFLTYLFASFESIAQSKHIIFDRSLSHSSQMAFFDSDKIEKIVSNLLSNAFKFTPENGRIIVAVKYLRREPDGEASSINLRISDNGIGIDPERLPRIFDRFYQADDGRRRHYEGTGIGLALVKELVNALHGTIDASSEPGKGSVFTVNIPCDHATWAKYLSVNETILPDLRTSSEVFYTEIEIPPIITSRPELPVLLVVEDNPDLRKYVRTIFDGTYQVEEAQDGQEGLEMAIKQIPDLVICDLMMPHMDGFAFCKALKTDLRTNHIPVVMLTAKAALEDRLEGLELGADDYLAKPFNTDELQIRVRNLLKQRQVLHQKYQTAVALDKDKAEENSVANDPFLERINRILEGNISNSSLDVEQLAAGLNVTSVQLRRKLKALTDQTVTEFMRNYRLDKAAILLQNRAGSVSEIAYMVGFESLSYFSRMFQERFSKRPSDWS